MVARPLDSCGVPSALSTSVITRKAFLRPGSGYRATGLSRQSEALPSACAVELPSNAHIGQSSSASPKLVSTRVLLRRFWVGEKPSSQMYSSLVFIPLLAPSCVTGLQMGLE